MTHKRQPEPDTLPPDPATADIKRHAGALGGMAVGAVIGSILPGIGTATGMIIGGVIGHFTKDRRKG